jgi:hypothetical protein
VWFQTAGSRNLAVFAGREALLPSSQEGIALKVLLSLAAVLSLVVLSSIQLSGRTSAQAGLPSLVWWLDNPAQTSGTAVPGAFSTLQRGYFSVTIALQTYGLTPGNGYTLWWVIFQDPGACIDGCGDDDINAAAWTGANPAGIGVHYGGSFVAPASGRAEIGSRLLENAVEGCVQAMPYAPLCRPMLDASTAEVLVFLVDNGPAPDGPPPFNGFDAGCSRLVWFGYTVAQYNNGPYDCYRAQSTFHRP